jgi:predicted permease
MLKNYLLIAYRNIVRHKGYTLINVLGLALGIACSLLIFLLVKFHLSSDTYHTHARHIYRIVTEMHFPEGTGYTPGVPIPLGEAIKTDFPQIKKSSMVLSNYGFLLAIPNPDKGTEDRFLENSGIALVEPAFFDIFDYEWLAGNPETALTEPNSVVITEKWAKKFFGNRNPIGQVMKADNKHNFKVTGLLKDYPANTDLKYDMFVSYTTHKAINPQYYMGNWAWINSASTCYIRLSDEFTAKDLTQALPEFHKKYYTQKDNVHHHVLQPLRDVHFNQQYYGSMQLERLYVMALIGVVILVIACINFINLSTAQAVRRSKEVGVRKVLGSTQPQLFWQFMNETALLTLAAVAISLVIAKISLPYLNEWMQVSLALNLFTDPVLLFFLALLTIVVVILSGFYPALVLSGFKPALALKGKITSSQAGGLTLRRSLVIAQFTISQALIIGILVMAYQIEYFKNADVGFKKEAIVNVTLFERDSPKLETFRNKLAQIPDIAGVSYSLSAPMSSGNNNYDFFRFDTRTEREGYQINVKAADHHFLETYELKLVAGRNLLPSDTAREIIVNETLVYKLGLTKPEEILGKTMHTWGGSFPVVGVVKDFHLHSLQTGIDPCIITTSSRDYYLAGIQVKSSNFSGVIQQIEKAWNEVFPAEVFEFSFLDETIASQYRGEEIMARLTNVFAAIAVFISCLGLYGLVSFMALQKTKEIGVRKVLGASSMQILLLFSKEFVRLLIIAFVIAAPLAWVVMNKWLQNFEFQITITPDIFGIAALITLLVAAFTVGYQSLKASAANPVKSLRNE